MQEDTKVVIAKTKRELSSDETGQVPFALIAVIILVLASFSGAYLTGVNRESVDARQQRLEQINTVLEEYTTELKNTAEHAVLNALESDTSHSAVMWQINEWAVSNFTELIEPYLDDLGYNTSQGYNIKLSNPTMSVSTVPMEYDGVNSLGMSVKMKSSTYFTTIGSVDIKITDTETGHIINTKLDLGKVVPSTYPFMMEQKLRLLYDIESEGLIPKIARYLLNNTAASTCSCNDYSLSPYDIDTTIIERHTKDAIDFSMQLEDIMLFHNTNNNELKIYLNSHMNLLDHFDPWDYWSDKYGFDDPINREYMFLDISVYNNDVEFRDSNMGINTISNFNIERNIENLTVSEYGSSSLYRSSLFDTNEAPYKFDMVTLGDIDGDGTDEIITYVDGAIVGFSNVDIFNCYEYKDYGEYKNQSNDPPNSFASMELKGGFISNEQLDKIIVGNVVPDAQNKEEIITFDTKLSDMDLGSLWIGDYIPDNANDNIQIFQYTDSSSPTQLLSNPTSELEQTGLNGYSSIIVGNIEPDNPDISYLIAYRFHLFNQGYTNIIDIYKYENNGLVNILSKSSFDSNRIFKDIVTGDINGDGVDEIITYDSGSSMNPFGDYGYITAYSFENGQLNEIGHIDVDEDSYSFDELIIGNIYGDEREEIVAYYNRWNALDVYEFSEDSDDIIHISNSHYEADDVKYHFSFAQLGDMNGDGYKEIITFLPGHKQMITGWTMGSATMTAYKFNGNDFTVKAFLDANEGTSPFDYAIIGNLDSSEKEQILAFDWNWDSFNTYELKNLYLDPENGGYANIWDLSIGGDIQYSVTDRNLYPKTKFNFSLDLDFDIRVSSFGNYYSDSKVYKETDMYFPQYENETVFKDYYAWWNSELRTSEVGIINSMGTNLADSDYGSCDMFIDGYYIGTFDKNSNFDDKKIQIPNLTPGNHSIGITWIEDGNDEEYNNTILDTSTSLPLVIHTYAKGIPTPLWELMITHVHDAPNQNRLIETFKFLATLTGYPIPEELSVSTIQGLDDFGLHMSDFIGVIEEGHLQMSTQIEGASINNVLSTLKMLKDSVNIIKTAAIYEDLGINEDIGQAIASFDYTNFKNFQWHANNLPNAPDPGYWGLWTTFASNTGRPVLLFRIDTNDILSPIKVGPKVKEALKEIDEHELNNKYAVADFLSLTTLVLGTYKDVIFDHIAGDKDPDSNLNEIKLSADLIIGSLLIIHSVGKLLGNDVLSKGTISSLKLITTIVNIGFKIIQAFNDARDLLDAILDIFVELVKYVVDLLIDMILMKIVIPLLVSIAINIVASIFGAKFASVITALLLVPEGLSKLAAALLIIIQLVITAIFHWEEISALWGGRLTEDAVRDLEKGMSGFLQNTLETVASINSVDKNQLLLNSRRKMGVSHMFLKVSYFSNSAENVSSYQKAAMYDRESSKNTHQQVRCMSAIQCWTVALWRQIDDFVDHGNRNDIDYERMKEDYDTVAEENQYDFNEDSEGFVDEGGGILGFLKTNHDWNENIHVNGNYGTENISIDAFMGQAETMEEFIILRNSYDVDDDKYIFENAKVGDFDGDGLDEILVDDDGRDTLQIYRTDSHGGIERIGFLDCNEDKDPGRKWQFDHATVGDVDGDGKDEIITYSDGIPFGDPDDTLAVYGYDSGVITVEVEPFDTRYDNGITGSGTKHEERQFQVAHTGDLDGDGIDEIIVVADEATIGGDLINVFKVSGNTLVHQWNTVNQGEGNARSYQFDDITVGNVDEDEKDEIITYSDGGSEPLVGDPADTLVVYGFNSGSITIEVEPFDTRYDTGEVGVGIKHDDRQFHVAHTGDLDGDGTDEIIVVCDDAFGIGTGGDFINVFKVSGDTFTHSWNTIDQGNTDNYQFDDITIGNVDANVGDEIITYSDNGLPFIGDPADTLVIYNYNDDSEIIEVLSESFETADNFEKAICGKFSSITESEQILTWADSDDTLFVYGWMKQIRLEEFLLNINSSQAENTNVRLERTNYAQGISIHGAQDWLKSISAQMNMLQHWYYEYKIVNQRIEYTNLFYNIFNFSSEHSLLSITKEPEIHNLTVEITRPDGLEFYVISGDEKSYIEANGMLTINIDSNNSYSTLIEPGIYHANWSTSSKNDFLSDILGDGAIPLRSYEQTINLEPYQSKTFGGSIDICIDYSKVIKFKLTNEFNRSVKLEMRLFNETGEIWQPGTFEIPKNDVIEEYEFIIPSKEMTYLTIIESVWEHLPSYVKDLIVPLGGGIFVFFGSVASLSAMLPGIIGAGIALHVMNPRYMMPIYLKVGLDVDDDGEYETWNDQKIVSSSFNYWLVFVEGTVEIHNNIRILNQANAHSWADISYPVENPDDFYQVPIYKKELFGAIILLNEAEFMDNRSRCEPFILSVDTSDLGIFSWWYLVSYFITVDEIYYYPNYLESAIKW